MSDYECTKHVLTTILDSIGLDSVTEAAKLIGKNQNRPPLGEADGSFTDETWTICRDAIRALENFMSNTRKLK